jgi:hypothetical protein
MLDSALAGIERLTALQRQALAEPLPTRPVVADQLKKQAGPRSSARGQVVKP